MNPSFYNGFIKRASMEKEAVIGRLLASTGKALGKGLWSLGQKVMGKGFWGVVNTGLTGAGIAEGASAGFNAADAGRKAQQAFKRGQITV